MRLKDGPTPGHGRLEIYHAGIWGTVQTWGFDSNAANVVCRALGYGTSQTWSYFSSNCPKVAIGSGTVWLRLDSTGCTGAENSLANCSFTWNGVEHAWGENLGGSANHIYDVCVDCANQPPSPPSPPSPPPPPRPPPSPPPPPPSPPAPPPPPPPPHPPGLLDAAFCHPGCPHLLNESTALIDADRNIDAGGGSKCDGSSVSPLYRVHPNDDKWFAMSLTVRCCVEDHYMIFAGLLAQWRVGA